MKNSFWMVLACVFVWVGVSTAQEPVHLFVPGRLCLFGEHSDWASSYRAVNPKIEKGMALIAGLDRGIYATAEAGSDRFVFVNSQGNSLQIDIPMTEEALQKEAEAGGFFSYVAGVALQMLKYHHVRGITIVNYRTDLPIQKGFSSSAAVCVLTARAFNIVYNLRLSLDDEMELAYLGEKATGSSCGRMDQACAYGPGVVSLTFDGSVTKVEKMVVGKKLFFVLVDLDGIKDTKKILTSLQGAFPFPKNEQDKKVHQYLGKANLRIIKSAIDMLCRGSACDFGRLMSDVQHSFDLAMAPMCPSQLLAPRLHRVLLYPPIQPYIFGGKGVGAQGDGGAQLLAKDEASQREIIRIIENELKMRCYSFSIGSPEKAAA